MRLNDDNKTVAAMDVLVPGVGELIGGSQREDRLDVSLPHLLPCSTALPYACVTFGTLVLQQLCRIRSVWL